MIGGSVMWIAWPVLAAGVVFWQSRRRTGWPRVVAAVALVTYALWICSVAFFPIPTHETVAAMSPSELHALSWINWVPLRELVHHIPRMPASRIVREFGGNLLLFVPFTLFCPLVWQRLRTWRWPLLVGLGGSVAIETIQLVLSGLVGFPYRQPDVDDVIVNTFGAFLGYAVFRAVARSVREVRRRD